MTWFWNNLTNGTTGWMAASYFCHFWISLIVGGVELVAFFLFWAGMPDLVYLWVPTVGFYGSILAYPISPMLALVHMTEPVAHGGLYKVSYSENYTNDIFLMMCGMLQWAFTSVAHLNYTNRFIAHAKAISPKPEPEVIVPAPGKEEPGSEDQDIEPIKTDNGEEPLEDEELDEEDKNTPPPEDKNTPPPEDGNTPPAEDNNTSAPEDAAPAADDAAVPEEDENLPEDINTDEDVDDFD